MEKIVRSGALISVCGDGVRCSKRVEFVSVIEWAQMDDIEELFTSPLLARGEVDEENLVRSIIEF